MGQRIRVLICLLGPCLFSVSAGQAMAAEAGEYSVNQKFAFLVGALVVGITALFAVQFVLRHLIAALQNRRACRIPAVLKTGDLEFSGLVTVIGLTGCRFQPINKAVEVRLLSLMNSPVFHDFDIKIGPSNLPVFLDGYHGFFTPAYFYHQLEQEGLEAFLTLSMIAPYPVSRIGHHSTRRKFRRDIDRRIRELAATGHKAPQVAEAAPKGTAPASAPALP